MSIEYGIPKYAALLHFALELNSTRMIVNAEQPIYITRDHKIQEQLQILMIVYATRDSLPYQFGYYRSQ
jgi:hypothetical protein